MTPECTVCGGTGNGQLLRTFDHPYLLSQELYEPCAACKGTGEAEEKRED